MAINVADNFSYKGSKPLDARIKYETVAAMAGAATADLYDGCMAYVTATKKYYSYDSTNTTDPTTGKWREYSSGGGGGADTEIIADYFDATESYAVGDYVVYEGVLYKCTTAHTGAWDASDFDATQVMEEMPTPMPSADMSEVVNPLPSVMSRRFKYSTTEQVVGEWIDGKPVYQKTFSSLSISLSSAGDTAYYTSQIDALLTDIKPIKCQITGVNGGYVTCEDACIRTMANNKWILYANNDMTINELTIQYTKTTD